MPVINIEGPKMTKEQKSRLIRAIVIESSKILEIPEDAFVTVIKENEFDNIGNGTQLLSEKMKGE